MLPLLLLAACCAGSAEFLPHAVTVDHPMILRLHHAAEVELDLRLEPGREGASVCVSLETMNQTKEWETVGIPECFASGSDVSRVYDADPDADNHLVLSTNETNPIAFDLSYSILGTEAYAQPWLASVILFAVYAAIAIEVVHKTLVAVIGALVALLVLTLFGKQPHLAEVATWVDSGTLVLLLGMMVFVEFLTQTGLFERLAILALQRCRGDVTKLFVMLCLLCGLMSTVIPNVTAILLVGPLTVQICSIADVQVVPFLFGEIFMSNIWGAATLVGDPPNTIVGAAFPADITFASFLWNTLPCALLVSVIVMKFLLWKYQPVISGTRLLDCEDLLRDHPIHSHKLLRQCLVVFVAMFVGFIISSPLNISPAWVALTGAVTMMLLAAPHDAEEVLSRVDWDMLTFFAALFVLIEALTELGLIRAISGIFQLILAAVPDESARLLVAMVLFVWLSSIFSAFVDNIPYAITMIPVLESLVADETLALPLRPLAFALLLGADFGGNGTILGSSANIVGVRIAARAGERVTFVQFMKVGLVVLLLSACTATVWCFVVYGAIGVR